MTASLISWIPRLENARCGRVKSLNFHPNRPWILVSLHSGSLQVWDYRLGVRVDSFDQKLSVDGYTGPVRSVVFHPSQPIFASASDDHKVRLWNYKLKKCTHTFQGHVDYVRSVAFHTELPWIITASDDQTVRIWNWQSRSCIAIITGHTHYVMCAAFHPSPSTQSIIITCSLDQTVRIWDYSALKKKHSASSTTSTSTADYCSPFDVVVKHVLEGHDRGVNWVTFHPTKPLIASCSDDRLVKLWRYNDSRAWELETFRGHTNNVSSVTFHPTRDWLISDAEDKTLRVWDLQKKSAILVHRKEGERFWSLAVHPTNNLIAAGHDSGFVVFKLENERPALCTNSSPGEVWWVKEGGIVKHVAFTAPSKESNVFQVGKKIAPVRAIDLHSGKIIVCYSDGTSELASLSGKLSEAGKELPLPNSFFVEAGIVSWESGASSFFLAEQETGEVVDEFALSSPAKAIFKLKADSVLVLDSTSKIINYDLRSHSALASIDVAVHGKVKRIALSNDGAYLAVAFKKTILVFDSSLASSLVTVSESCPVKSILWNSENVLLYSTVQHLKFMLLNGETGILSHNSSQPEYIVGAVKGKVFTLTRSKTLACHPFEQSELDLKLALEAKDFARVFAIINNCNLIGQSIIAYLRRKGYPQIALAFVKDPASRFELAIECANLEVALQVAEKLNVPSAWQALAEEAMKQGNFSIAETAYQKGCQLEKLAFLYCLTGQQGKMRKLQELSLSLGDESVHFLCGAFTGTLSQSSSALPPALAYLAAKRAGEAIRGVEEVDEWPLKGDSESSSLEWKCCDSNWPIEKAEDYSQFHTEELQEEEAEEEIEEQSQSPSFHQSPSYEDSIDEAGWEDLIVERPSSPESLEQLIEAKADSNQIKAYLKEHLNITNTAPLSPYLSQPLPTLSAVNEGRSEALSLTTNGKFREAKAAFIKTLYQALLLPAKDHSKANEIITQCSNYILGLAMETSRKDPSNSASTNLRLAVLFSRCALQHEHSILALRSATSLAFKSGNWNFCLALCERLLGMDPEEAVAAQTRKIEASCKAKMLSGAEADVGVEGLGEGANEVERAAQLGICSVEFRAVGPLEAVAECAVCGAVAAVDHCGERCRVCELAVYE